MLCHLEVKSLSRKLAAEENWDRRAGIATRKVHLKQAAVGLPLKQREEGYYVPAERIAPLGFLIGIGRQQSRTMSVLEHEN